MARSNRRNRNPRRRETPSFDILEDVSIATADTASNNTVYNPQVGTGTLEAPGFFHLRGATWSVNNSSTNTATRVLCIIRKVPNGYAFPSITVASGVTAIAGSDVLAFGLINTTALATNEVPSQELTIVRPRVRVDTGDTIACQIVSNVSSASQTAFVAIYYGAGAY